MTGALQLSCVETMLGDGTLAQRFSRARAAGFDGVDLRGDSVGAVVDDVRNQMERTGLGVPTVYGRLPAPILARTARERADAVEVIRGRLRDANAVGAGRLILVPVFGPARLPLPESGVEEAELALLAILLGELAEDAERHRVRIVLEPLNRGETHLLRSPSAAAQVAERVESPWVGTMADTYHMDLEGQDPGREVAAAGTRLWLVHLSDRERTLPGEGGIDFGAVLEALDACGYDGYMGFECSVPFHAERLRRSVEWVRGLR